MKTWEPERGVANHCPLGKFLPHVFLAREIQNRYQPLAVSSRPLLHSVFCSYFSALLLTTLHCLWSSRDPESLLLCCGQMTVAN